MTRTHLLLGAAAVLVFSGMAWWTHRAGSGGAPPREPAGSSTPGRGPGDLRAEGEATVPGPTEEEVREVIRMLREMPEAPSEEELLPLAGTEAGVRGLVGLLGEGGPVGKRLAVLLALMQSPVESARDAVLEAARGGFGPELRTGGILALAEGGGERAAALLEELAAGDPDLGVAGTALQALAHLNTAGAQKALARVLLSAPGEERERMFWMALQGAPVGDRPREAEAVRELRRRRFSTPAPDPEARDSWREILDRAAAARGDMAMAAAAAILRIPGPEAAETLPRTWENLDEPMRDGLIAQLDPVLSADKVPGLVRIVSRADDRERRLRLAEILEEWEDPDLLGDLRTWRDGEKDGAVRSRLEAIIRRLER